MADIDNSFGLQTKLNRFEEFQKLQKEGRDGQNFFGVNR
jgi:hypothetical protein